MMPIGSGHREEKRGHSGVSSDHHHVGMHNSVANLSCHGWAVPHRHFFRGSVLCSDPRWRDTRVLATHPKKSPI
jgi:hypothetical protein